MLFLWPEVRPLSQPIRSRHGHEGDESRGGPSEGDARIAIVDGEAGRDASYWAVVEGHGLVVEGRGYEGQGAVVVDTIWVVVTSTAKDKLTVQAFGRLDL